MMTDGYICENELVMIPGKEPDGGFVYGLRDEVGVRQWGLFSVGDLNGCDIEVFGETDIGGSVADHGSVIQVDVKVTASGFQHSRVGLAAIAGCIGSMWAVVDAV